MFKSIKGSVERVNGIYFQTLANSRASVSMMAISWTGAFFLGVNLIFRYFYLVKGYDINPLFDSLFDVILVYFVYLLMASIFGFSRTWIYKKQILSTILLFFSYLGIYFSLMLTCYSIFTYQGNTLESYNSRSVIAIFSILISIAITFVYNFLWFRNQIRVGFSLTRASSNYFAKKSIYSKPSFALIFASALLGSIVTGNFILILTILMMLLFSYAFSQLLMEVTYLLFLKIKSKDYWEDIPLYQHNESSRKFSFKKTKVRLVSEIIVFIIFSIIIYILSKYDNRILQLVWVKWSVRVLTYVILVDLVLSVIVSKVKKYNLKGK